MTWVFANATHHFCSNGPLGDLSLHFGVRVSVCARACVWKCMRTFASLRPRARSGCVDAGDISSACSTDMQNTRALERSNSVYT